MRILRYLTLTAVALLCTVVLVGCGGGGDNGDDDEDRDSRPQEVSAEDIIPMYQKSAVFILAEGFYGGASSGTGIVMDSQGHILTNNHVMDGAGSISVRDPESGRMIPARIVGRSPCDDLAVIQVRESSNFSPARLGSTSSLRPGSQVYAVGYPAAPSERFGETRLSITGGLVSKLDAQFEFLRPHGPDPDGRGPEPREQRRAAGG